MLQRRSVWLGSIVSACVLLLPALAFAAPEAASTAAAG